ISAPRPLRVVHGAVAPSARITAGGAARACGAGIVSGAASAGVRLLGLDPIDVSAMLAGLTIEVDRVAALAASFAHTDIARLALLPAGTGPLLDILAERHDHREMSLFAS